MQEGAVGYQRLFLCTWSPSWAVSKQTALPPAAVCKPKWNGLMFSVLFQASRCPLDGSVIATVRAQHRTQMALSGNCPLLCSGVPGCASLPGTQFLFECSCFSNEYDPKFIKSLSSVYWIQKPLNKVLDSFLGKGQSFICRVHQTPSILTNLLVSDRVVSYIF